MRGRGGRVRAGEGAGRGEAARDLEAAAFQLVRCYNALEQAALRVAKAFENQINDDAGWHAEVMRRLTLDLPDIRPAVFRPSDLAHLRELRGFRNVIVPAYDLALDRERILRLMEHGREVLPNSNRATQNFSTRSGKRWRIESAGGRRRWD